MDQSRLMEANFMFCRMDIHIDLVRVDGQIKDIGGLLIGSQFILVSLPDGVIDEFIAHHAAIHIAVL